ncbi:MAG: hypothetical protein ACOCV4_05060 [Myxococcota bacterium]
MLSRSPWALVLVAVLGLVAGCELVVDFDRSRIGGEGGVDGAVVDAATDGSTDAAGDAGPDAAGDAGMDAAGDAGPDAASDAGPDAAGDGAAGDGG